MNIFLNQKDLIEHPHIQIHLTRDNKCIIQTISNKNKISKNELISHYIKNTDNTNYEYDNSFLNFSKYVPSEDLMNLSITQNDINTNSNNITNNGIRNNNHKIIKDNSENSENIVNFSELLDTTKSNNNINIISNSIIYNSKNEEKDVSFKKNEINLSNISNLNSNKKIISINSDTKTPLKYLKKQFNNNKKKVIKNNNDNLFRKNLLDNFNDNSEIKEKKINNINNNEKIYDFKNDKNANKINNTNDNDNYKICNENINILNINSSFNNRNILPNKRYNNSLIDNDNDNNEERKIIVNRISSYRMNNDTEKKNNNIISKQNKEKIQNKDKLIRVTKKSNFHKILKENNNKIKNQNRNNFEKYRIKTENLSKSNSHYKIMSGNLPKNNSNFSMTFKTLNNSEISPSTLQIKHNTYLNIKNKKKSFNKIYTNKISEKPIKKHNKDINKTNYKNYINMSKNNTKIIKANEHNSNTETAIFISNEKKTNEKKNKKLINNKQNIKKSVNLTFNGYRYEKLKTIDNSLCKDKELYSYKKNKTLNRNNSIRKSLTFRSRNSESYHTIRNSTIKKEEIKPINKDKDNKNNLKKKKTKSLFEEKSFKLKMNKNKNITNKNIKRNKSHINKKTSKKILKYINQIIKLDNTTKNMSQKILKTVAINNPNKSIESRNKTERFSINQIPIYSNSEITSLNDIFPNKRRINKNIFKEHSNYCTTSNLDSIPHESSVETRNIPKIYQLNTFTYKSLKSIQGYDHFQHLKRPKEIISNFSKYKKRKDNL